MKEITAALYNGCACFYTREAIIKPFADAFEEWILYFSDPQFLSRLPVLDSVIKSRRSKHVVDVLCST